MIERGLHACQLATIGVFLGLILPLVLASACLEAGKGVKSRSSHSQAWLKLWRKV
jgi:hypothetical protein